ncbi:exodeoxyribonuclease V subunit beta [Desulfovibrionales bacterium]
MTRPYFDLCTAPLAGTTLIEASAGTGKTYTLSGLFLRLLVEQRVPVDKILVVTFTTAATEELRGRIRSRLAAMATALELSTAPDEPLEAWLWEHYRHTDARELVRAAVQAFDLAQIFTIHSFCQRMLNKNSFACQTLFETTLEPDMRDLVRQTCLDFWRTHIAPRTGLTGAMVRQQLDPDALVALASLPMLPQIVRVEPDNPGPDTDPLEQRWTGLVDHMRELWAKDQEAIRTLLYAHPGCNQKMGSPAQLDQRFAALEIFFTVPSLEIPKEVACLSTEYIRKMTKEGFEPPQHLFFDVVGQLCEIAACLTQAVTALVIHLRYLFVTGLETELDRRKAQRNVQGYDDLLRQMHQAVLGPQADQVVAAARSQYQAALIDEFQDTDALQYHIFTTLFGGQDQSLFLIGDPKQAIYSFRGADIHTYLHAARKCTYSATLGVNYRSSPELIQAVNQIFSGPRPFIHADISYQPVSWPNRPPVLLLENETHHPPLVIWHVKPDDPKKPLSKEKLLPRLCHAVTAEISRLLHKAHTREVRIGDRPLRAGDIAVLVETHDQAELIHQHLRAHNIHSVLIHSTSVLASPEAREVLAVLRAMLEYQRATILRPALATVLLGLDAPALHSLEAGSPEYDLWLERMASWHNLWERHGILAAMRTLLAETKARARLLSLVGGERRMTNVLHCLEILHIHERQSQTGMRVLTDWFGRQLDTARQDDFQLRLDSDRDAVQIVTIHRSKGLEYPVVFCPFLSSKARVDSQWALARDNGLTLDLGSALMEDRLAQAEQEAQAELVRRAYVALTRAACRCYLAWGWIHEAYKSGLAWVFHGHRAATPRALTWKTTSAEQVHEDLYALAGPHITVVDLPEAPARPGPPVFTHSPILQARSWTRIPKPTQCVSSFTSLTRGADHTAAPGFDDLDDPGDVPTGMTMAQFPRGVVAGSCLHRIFELVDFAAFAPETDSAVAQVLTSFGFSQDWTPVVQTMVSHVLETDLGGFCLRQIHERLVELEFFFPLGPVRWEDLALVYDRARASLGPDIPARMERLRFEPRQGFVTGFMDLVVRHNGRYYLLDWKSNWLGQNPGHYNADALRLSITDSYYFLQYHLYCLALDRYLRLRDPHYNPEKHFGGVRYIYVRGIDPAYPGCGVYADTPDHALLTDLSRLFLPIQEHP